MSTSHQHWIGPLAQRYSAVLSQQAPRDPEQVRHLNALQLASSLIDSSTLHQQYASLCPQIAIMGPTQSGKSTLVNLLLDASVAIASPLAGFTVHAQGYGAACSEKDLSIINEFMSPMERTKSDALDAQKLDSYVLEPAGVGPRALIDQAVVWDTPDFDSIEASTYAAAVYKTAALADVAMLVVSKDKYGDKRVWDVIELLHQLRKPIIICINKVDEADKELIRSAFSNRWREHLQTPVSPLVLLPYISGQQPESAPAFPPSSLDTLQDALGTALALTDRQAQARACEQFIDANQMAWLEPLLHEREALRSWQEMLRRAIEDADEQYANSYLNNPDKYETFNRALAELLSLLEIPGVARALGRTRQLVTWPARRLLGVGRSMIQNSSVQAGAGGEKVNQEAQVMQHVFDSALVGIQTQLLDQPRQPWWTALNQNYRDRLPHVRQTYNSVAEQARAEFEPQIESAAQSLYQQLQSQPRLLNTLRAARASADAAGVALAVKSGGLAPADLILAPAMLSVTTLLTESALGKYMNTVKQSLRQKQRRHTLQSVWQIALGRQLEEIAGSLQENSLFTSKLEPALLEHLNSLRHN
ncbi:MAG: GTPase domain-containing protein [Granulosicoccus sp.]